MTDKPDIQNLDPHFPEELCQEPGCQHLWRCFACGVCTAVCPVSQVEPNFSPSRIIRRIVQGRRQELLSSETLWHCLRCSACSFQCPQDVRFRDIVQGLRVLAVREGFVSPELAADLEEVEGLLQAVRRTMISRLLQSREAPGNMAELLVDCLQELAKPCRDL
jgi:heterodisulfide reductase subunit C